jgi:hypothetical protein
MDAIKGCWEKFKGYSGLILMLSTALIFLFGLFCLIASAYFGATFTTQTEEAAVIAGCVAGGLLLICSSFGFIAYRHPTRSMTAVVLCLSLALFIAGIVVIGIVVTYLKRVQRISQINPSPFPYEANITDPNLQVVSDFINSIYTTCCTGCSVAVCGQFLNETAFCPEQLTLSNPECTFVTKCTHYASNQKNCFFSRGSNDTTPPFPIGHGICQFLENSAWGPDNVPVVGALGSVANAIDRSCGGGDPRFFQFSLSNWLTEQYGWISAIVGLVLFLLFMMAVTIFAYGVHMREAPEKKNKIHNQLRPFG